jgi:hypothetical protein
MTGNRAAAKAQAGSIYRFEEVNIGHLTYPFR